MSNGEMWDKLFERVDDIKREWLSTHITTVEELGGAYELLGKVLDFAKDALCLAFLALWVASTPKIRQHTRQGALIVNDGMVKGLKQAPVSPELAPIFEWYLPKNTTK